MSTSGERCAYFEGLAYLLDLRCFFVGRDDDVVGADTEGSVLITVAVRGRFVDVRGDAGESFSLVELPAYEYFANCLLNDAGGGEDRVSGGSESSLSLDGIVSTTGSICFERVWGISWGY
jgi:hypothetical protein